MITLNGTTETLQVTLGGANSHDFVINYDDVSAGGVQVPNGTAVNVAVTDQTALLSAPAEGGKKIVRSIHVRNKTANTTTVSIAKKVSSTSYTFTSAISLASGESADWVPGKGWTVYTSGGLVRTS